MWGRGAADFPAPRRWGRANAPATAKSLLRYAIVKELGQMVARSKHPVSPWPRYGVMSGHTVSI